MSNKTIEELEAERMGRFMKPPAERATAPVFKKAPAPAPEPVVTKAPPRTWEQKPSQSPRASPAPAKEIRGTNEVRAVSAPVKISFAQSAGESLQGTMDLSTRVEYLNSLIEQGAIDDDEYAARAKPLEVANEIIQACSRGDENALERLLKDNPSMNVDSIVEKESTPFSVAIGTVTTGKGSSRLLKLLLGQGAQINRRKAGWTPLLSLCERSKFAGAYECAKVLIDAGADATATTPVQGKGSTMSCISLAVEAGASPEFLKLLCQHGASPNDQCEPHGPLVVYCIIEEMFPQAAALLECGADPNSRQSGLGATCLAISISNRYYEICEKLLQHRADRDQQIMRDQQITAREMVAKLAKQDPAAFSRFERFF